MSLTATSTLVAAFVLTAAVIVSTSLLWRRWPRRGRLVLRTLSLLLSQAMVLVSAGLVFNTSEQLYPTLETLISPPKKKQQPVVAEGVSSGGLDEWLKARSQQGSRAGLAFPWQPAGGGNWPLAEHPVVSLPPQYFSQVSSRFPVIVVVAAPGVTPAAGGWADARVTGRQADPAIVVFVRSKAADQASVRLLGTELPVELTRDLRALTDRWSVVGVGKHAAGGLELVTRHPERYRAAAALLPSAPGELAGPGKALTAAHKPLAVFMPQGAQPPAGLPTPPVYPSAVPTGSVPPTSAAPATSAASRPPTSRAGGRATASAGTQKEKEPEAGKEPIVAALRWATAQLPAPLDPAQTAGKVSHSTLPPSIPPPLPTPSVTAPPATPTKPGTTPRP
ncbi:hypothetical protein [Longispora albida]|uniref:hypothetical protein n=1 Tax=Longispora albida TaxID=203523 RepID=UPI00039BC6AB|nr:hypothetical protein [Longispora albida]